MAQALQELDRELGTRHAPPVQVRTRRNRNTMASLRLDVDAQVWRFTVAEDLLRAHPHLVLDLGRLLLHRARRERPPATLLANLAQLRKLWAARLPVADAALRRMEVEEDDALACRLRAVATRLGHLPTMELPSIVWAKSTSRRVLGRYDSRARRIEIHAALRHPSVPIYLLDNLIAHELLHALLGPQRHGTRLVHHHGEFRRQEKAYPDYALAEAWTRVSWPRWVGRYLKKHG